MVLRRKHTDGRGESNKNVLFTCMKMSKKNQRVGMDIVTYACNPTTQEAEAGGSQA